MAILGLEIAHIGVSLSHAILLPSTHFRNTRAWQRLNVHSLRPILAGMAKAPEPPPQPITWTVYKIAAKQTRIGTVEAPDESAAIEKAAAEFRIPATKLHAVRQR